MAEEDVRKGRLRARPVAGVDSAAAPVGLRPLGFAAARGVYLYVPAGYRAERPVPLAVVLHGAGEDARNGLALLRAPADEAGLILLSPPRASTRGISRWGGTVRMSPASTGSWSRPLLATRSTRRG